MLKRREDAETELRKDIVNYASEAFPLVIVAPSLIQGIHTLVQAYGIGPLKVNTILLNWFENERSENLGIREILYGRRIKTAFRLGCNIIVLKTNAEEWEKLQAVSAEQRRIDVWWWDDASSHLMLLLAYLTTRNKAWHEAKIRVLAPSTEHPTEETMKELREKLADARIEAEPEMVFNANMSNVIAYSKNASLVFLPFRLKDNQPLDPFDNPIEQVLSDLPLTALVLAAKDIVLEAEPDNGKAGEIATALDAMADAEKRKRQTEKAAEEAREKVSTLKEKLLRLDSEPDKKSIDPSERQELQTLLAAAEEAAEKMKRRAAKARAKAETTSKAVENLGIQPPKSSEKSEETDAARDLKK
jgi:hypothetical protein